MPPSDTAAVLVNWNNATDTLACIASLRALAGPAPAIVVVDNGSSDDSIARLRAQAPGIVLIEAGRNLGFGPACNRAIAHARDAGARYIWLLNNDATAAPTALAALRRALDADPGIGAVGSVIYRGDSTTEIDCWGGGRISFLTGQPTHLIAPGTPDYITGASMLLRIEALTAIDGFDESYFLYWEDADLCFRLKRAGWRLAVAADSRVHHAISASASKTGVRLIRYYNTGAMRFFRTYAPFPLVPITANFLYRFLGQLRAGNLAEARALARVTFGLDRVCGPTQST